MVKFKMIEFNEPILMVDHLILIKNIIKLSIIISY